MQSNRLNAHAFGRAFIDTVMMKFVIGIRRNWLNLWG